jgi:hypothetical protein
MEVNGYIHVPVILSSGESAAVLIEKVAVWATYTYSLQFFSLFLFYLQLK